MPVNIGRYREILVELGDRAKLVAVSKVKPVEDIMELYDLGQRDFGENYVQELVDKQVKLPSDIRWHFIGHLQSNKVRYITPFVHLVQGVDSYKLLKEIDKQAQKCGRVIDCLLQVHIAQEETKFGFDAGELETLMGADPESVLLGRSLSALENVRVSGLMGMASFSSDPDKIRGEFRYLKQLFDKFMPGQMLSMGMSGDYKIAVEEGSNMVRIGSLLFGDRVYPVAPR